jgi:hypothetical protein
VDLRPSEHKQPNLREVRNDYEWNKWPEPYPAFKLDDYTPYVEWSISDAKLRRMTVYYPCNCPEPYPYIYLAYNVTIQRASFFYVINVLVPVGGVYVVMLTSFCLPCESGEKTSLNLTAMLSRSVFQMFILEVLPENSTSMPLMGFVIIFLFGASFVGVVSQVVVLNVRSKGARLSEMPRWLSSLNTKLAPFFCAGYLDNDQDAAASISSDSDEDFNYIKQRHATKAAEEHVS